MSTFIVFLEAIRDAVVFSALIVGLCFVMYIIQALVFYVHEERRRRRRAAARARRRRSYTA